MNIKPFKGIFYNQSKVTLKDVVTPPYDVISPAEQDEYYKKNDFNVIRLDFNKKRKSDTETNNRYTRAVAHLNDWLNKGILYRDKKSSLFLYEQTFETNNKRYCRRGLLALVKIYDFETGKILPHERTLPKAQEDRFNLIKATEANFSNIFGLYADKEKNIDKILNDCKTEKIAEIEFQNVLNRLSAINNPEDIKKIQNNFKKFRIYIADGHHRYKISLMYRDLMRAQNPLAAKEAPWEFVMMNLVNTYSEGLVILPTHRLVGINDTPENIRKQLAQCFYMDKKGSVEDLLHSLESNNGKKVLGVYDSKEYFLLTLKSDLFLKDIPSAKIEVIKNLDVILLHEVALYKCLGIDIDAPERGIVKFVVDPYEAVSKVDKDYGAVFFLNATKINQVRSVAEQGQIMPQKSTYFYPKLLTGLVMRKLED